MIDGYIIPQMLRSDLCCRGMWGTFKLLAKKSFDEGKDVGVAETSPYHGYGFDHVLKDYGKLFAKHADPGGVY